MLRFRVSRLLVVTGVAAVLGAAGVVAGWASDGGSAASRVRPAATGPCDGDIAFGEIIACTINAAGQAKDTTFPGTNGDRIRIRAVKTSGTLTPKTQVRRPNGTVVCADTTAQEFTCVLDASGTHTIRVADSSGTATGSFNLTVQRLNDPVGCVKGKFGTGKNGAINEAAEIDCFSVVKIKVGDVLRVRTAETGGSLFAGMEVVRPDGTTLCPNTGVVELTCTADVAGTYRILVKDNNGTGTGTYATWLQRLNNPAGCTTVAYGDPPLAGSIDAAAETDCYKLTGSTGDQLRLRVVKTSGSFTPYSEVTRPDGTTLCGPTTAQEYTCLMNANGSHTILVRDVGGTATGGYVVVTQRLNNPVGCSSIGYGSPGKTGNIATAGQIDCFTRASVAAGDVLRVRTAETGGSLFAGMEVVRPDGTTLCPNTGVVELTCTADVAGTYRILVKDNNGTGTGTYATWLQRLNNPAGCTTVAYGDPPLAGSIDAAAETDCYKLTGSTGDQLRLRVVKTSGSFTPYSEVTRPDGTTLCGPTTAQEYTCLMNANGSHTILVRDVGGTATGGYVVVTQRLNNPVGCSSIGYGSPGKTGNIATAGQIDCFTRASVAAGDVLRVRTAETGGSLFAGMEVVRPDGTTLCPNTGVVELTCTADVAGTYRILVKDNNGTGTGTYATWLQRLNNPAGCTTVAYGDPPLAGSIDAAAETDCYKLTGSTGDQLRLRVVKTSGSFTPYSEVTRPDGTTLCGPTTAQEYTCLMNANGSHTILVRDVGGTATGGYVVVTQRLNNPVGCSSIGYGSPGKTGNIATAGQIDCFTRASVAAGDVLRVRTAETGGSLFAGMEVVRPDGTTLCPNTGVVELTCTADVAGTYRILVKDNNGTGTGTYATWLQRLNNPAGCTTVAYGDPPLAGSIDAAAETDCFSFSGSNGDLVRVRVTKTSGSFTPYVEVVRPNGTTVCGPTTSGDFNCALDVNGSHTILVRDVSGANTGNYTVRVNL